MDSNSWINRPSFFSSPSSSSSSSRRYHQSRSDLYLGGGFEDFQGEDDLNPELICPFCAEDFDIVGLCCHIDEEHPVEAKNGVCPVCTKRVGVDIIGHITTQHRNLLKVQQQQRRRRLRRGGYSSSAYAMPKRELPESYLQSRLIGSSNLSSSINVDSDPLLSSFMLSSPSKNESANRSATKASSHKQTLERDIREEPLSGEDQEKARKKAFVRSLLLSTMLDGDI